MAHVHYKFSSKLSYDMVVFDGPHTTLSELKKQIMGKEKLRAADCDLQITNAQTKQEYTGDDDLIAKGSSVIVRRIPIIGARRSSNKSNNIQRSDVQLPHAFGASRAMDEQKSTSTLSFFSKMANLADADVPEEDKLKVLMSQSICDSMNLTKKSGSLPGSYTCYRCGLSGHHIRNCPTIGQDKNAEAPLKIKKSTGIPRSFMVEVDDPSIKGAMLTNCGRYAIPAIDAEAYAIGKKEKPPFFVQELESEEDPIPDELLCVICRDLLCDSVVIPCCGNSYCDDCIRTTLLDSDDHVCPTCSQSDVSPDTLIANKFLRQAVNTFKKERGYANKKQPAATPSQNLNPTPKPVPTTPLPSALKPQHSRFRQQDSLQAYPKPAKTPPLSQVPVAPPAATCPASVDSTPSVSSESVDNNQEMSPKDNSPSSCVSSKDPTAAPSQLAPLGNDISMAEQPQSVGVNQQASSGSAEHSKPSTSLNSSASSAGCPTGSWNESIKQHPTPPSPYAASIFHMNLPAHQSNGCFPPGYPPTTPIWTPAALQGSIIPSLCSPTPSVPMEWYRHQRKESSPHRSSSSRRSSGHSKAKSKSSQYYSHSSSRSESRSRSRSKGRSRHRSPYSRRRDHHSRPSSSYIFGYKRSHSPTPSSSSSPRGSYQSKSKSPTDHRRNRHHSKRSSSSIRRRGERSRKDAAGASQQAEQRIQSSNLELDRDRYLQWKKEYTEWCEKYFSSYVSHFHQLPFPPLPGPPPTCPQWEDKEGMTKNSQASCSNYQTQGRRTSGRDARSPSSDSSSYSRSPPSHSSSESHSTPSQSPSQSSPSHKESHCCSPPSQSSSDGLSAQSEDRTQTGTSESCTDNNSHLPVTQSERADTQQLTLKNVEESDLLKQEQREVKTQELERREGSSSPHAACDSEDESENKEKIKMEIPACGHEVSNSIDTLESVQQLLTPDRSQDKHHEKKDKEEKNLEKEKAKKRDKDSHSGRVEDGPHKVKTRKEPNLVDPYRKESSESRRGHDSRSAWNRKRKVTDLQRSDRERSPAVKHQSSKCHETKTAQNPESQKSDSPKPLEVKKQKKENNPGLRTKADIWEGGIKLKPQKKINININLDVKRKDESIDRQDLSNLESIKEKTQESTERVLVKEETINEAQAETEANEKKEAIKEEETLFTEATKPEEVEVAQIWDQTCVTDAGKVILDETKVGDEPEEDFTLWHCALSGAKEMDGEAEAETEGISHQGHPMEELATSSQKGEENPCKRIGGETMKEKRSVWGEEDPNMLTPQASKDETHPEQLTAADDDVHSVVGRCGAEESGERRNVKNLEEKPPGQAADGRNQRVLMQVFGSKWERGEEEEQDEGGVGVHTPTPPVALSQPSVTVTIREMEGDDGPHRQRSTEMEREQDRVMVMEKDQEAQRSDKASASNRGVVPSGGKDQTSSVSYSHRDSGGDRKQEEERKKSKEHKREKEKVRSRDRDLERSSVSPAKKGKISSHSSTSHEREREGSSRSSSGITSRRSSTGRRSTDPPDETPKKPSRDASPAWKSSHQEPSRTYRQQSRSAGSHHSSPSSHRHSKDRDLPPLESSAESPTRGWVQSKSRNESKRDQKERELNKVNKTKTCSKSGRDHREIADQERVRRREEEVFYKRYGETKLGRR